MERVLRKYGAEAGGRLDPTLVRPMMETRREYIEAALEAIRRDYGSLERVLEEALGVGLAERRELCERYTV